MNTITIITATYNSEKTIRDTIDSVLSQSYNDIEYIIVDGYSKDKTISIIQSYGSRIKYISEPDKGVYDAINKGLRMANGDYVLVLGSDDMLYDNKCIEHIVSEMHEKSNVYYGNVLWKGTNHVHWGRFNKLKWAWSNISHQALFYPKTVYKTHDYELKYRIYADNVYNLKLLKEGIKFSYIDQIVTLYAMEGLSSNLKDACFDEDRNRLIYEALGLIPLCVFHAHQLLIKCKKIARWIAKPFVLA